MLTKSPWSGRQIFSFFTSLIIVFFVGFFIWNILENNFEDKNLTASLTNYATEDIIQEGTVQPEQPDKNPSEEGYFDGLVTISGPQGTPAISVEEQLDDIQEKLDVIKQKIQELILERDQKAQLELEDEEKMIDDQEEQEQEEVKEVVSCVGQIDVNTASIKDLDKITGIGPVTAQKIIEARPFYSFDDLLKVSGIGEKTLQKIIEQGCAYVDFRFVPPPGVSSGSSGGGGGSPAQVVYPKILISEVKISPIAQRFIELYNPNNIDVSLTGWYLQRKTETASTWGSFVSSPKFLDKIILANGYFLISRENIEGAPNSDILFDITLSDNNSLVFKNPDEKISDEMSFGVIDDNKSIGRKPNEDDTDNDSADFEIDTPTPKAQNIAYVEPPPPADIDAPQVVFDILPTQIALNFPVNFTITDISTTTTPSGLANYVFQWQVEGDSDWQQDDPVNTGDGSQVRNFVGEDRKTYNFQVQATDLAGNVSGWLPVTPAITTINIPAPPPPVENMLANEFFDEGWEGTSSAGNPVNWNWGKRGGIAVEDPPLITETQSFHHEPYSSYYDLTQLGKTLETGKTYYAEIWVSGTGKVKLGIDHSGVTQWLSASYIDFNNAPWTKMVFSITATSDTDNDGIIIRMIRSVATGEKLVVGAAWLSTAEPPENWPLQ